MVDVSTTPAKWSIVWWLYSCYLQPSTPILRHQSTVQNQTNHHLELDHNLFSLCWLMLALSSLIHLKDNSSSLSLDLHATSFPFSSYQIHCEGQLKTLHKSDILLFPYSSPPPPPSYSTLCVCPMHPRVCVCVCVCVCAYVCMCLYIYIHMPYI